MSNIRKSVKILAGVTAVVLIIGVLWFANGLMGNPISKMMANNAAKKYIEENYNNIDLEIEDATYSFKSGDYYVEVKSPTSKDTHFTVSITLFGKVQYDTYEDDVIKKNNTYYRISSEYNDKIKKVFESKSFPYKSDIGFGDIAMKEENIDYGIDIESLELDKNYDMNEIGKQSGKIVFDAQDEEISIKKASEILLNIKNILNEKGIYFYAIDFTLEKPRDKNGEANVDDTSITLNEFLDKDIYEKDLETRVEKCLNDTKEYYKNQDMEKFQNE